MDQIESNELEPQQPSLPIRYVSPSIQECRGVLRHEVDCWAVP